MYAESIQIKEDYRCFKKDQTFTLENLTLLVGDQGCGKSTLLQGLNTQAKFLEINLTKKGEKGVASYYFDSELMNPRTKDPLLFTNIDGTNKGIGIGAALSSRFSSHGETLVNFSVKALKKAEDCILFLDEPESALSLRNQFRLAKEINKAVKRNCQVIVATHSLVLIQENPKVLSLEHQRWMDSKEFIAENQ